MGKVVAIVGGGGREHALGDNIGKSDKVSKVLYLPGNAGTQEGKGINVPLNGAKKENFAALADLIEKEDVSEVIIGPEAPLNAGLEDFLRYRGYNRVFGSSQAASVLEADKFFSFDIMRNLGIPQAHSIKCCTTDEAVRAINKTGYTVIKARGLTEGKGVTVCNSAKKALTEITNHATLYGPEVLIAERLFGQEFSVFGISDGNIVVPLDISLQDHKPLLDGDKGPNTGGMGAYGPAPIAPVSVVRQVANEIMNPVVQKMKEVGMEYKGFLYAGMIMTEQGPKVIEFNIRFGDPECQPAMMMSDGSLYDAISLSLDGKLSEAEIKFKEGASCCVVLASDGYPLKYEKGFPISGIDEANSIEGVKVFHAGTALKDGNVVTSGGRVLGVTAYSKEGIRAAQQLAYEGVSKISIPGGFSFRTDIAEKALR